MHDDHYLRFLQSSSQVVDRLHSAAEDLQQRVETSRELLAESTDLLKNVRVNGLCVTFRKRRSVGELEVGGDESSLARSNPGLECRS